MKLETVICRIWKYRYNGMISADGVALFMYLLYIKHNHKADTINPEVAEAMTGICNASNTVGELHAIGLIGDYQNHATTDCIYFEISKEWDYE